MPLGIEVFLSPGDFVLDGKAAPPFSVYVYCGKMAGWMKMTLGMEMGLCPGHIVLDGDPANLPQKGGRVGRVGRPPIFGPFLLWPNDWMHQDAAWYGGRPQLR